MISVVLFVVGITAAFGQGNVRDFRTAYYDETPKPYAFSYSAPSDVGAGQSSRSESADASGRVQGSYTINNEEGHYRVVDYVADENGFRANIRTNEPGTESKSPADVVLLSEAVPYTYTAGIRRPALNAELVNPVVNTVEPAVVPVPVQLRRPVYRRPVVPREYMYRANRYQNRVY